MFSVYLAGPYNHDLATVKDHRFRELTKHAGSLMALGVLVYSPITHNHPIALRSSLPGTWEFWKQFDLAVLKHCKQLIVLKLPGWETSTGVAAEIEFCQKNYIPITYVDPIEDKAVPSDSDKQPHVSDGSPRPNAGVIRNPSV